MNNITVTNEMLYELFKEFREDFKGFKVDANRRFEQIDKRFDQVDRRFGYIEKRLDQLEKYQFEDHKILTDPFGIHTKQKVNFSSIYIITFLYSVLAAIATSYIMN